MPTYEYKCPVCAEDFERVVPIEERNAQCCRRCGCHLDKKITFTGLTWAPTAGGMR